jgi:branched-chain amino acid transport system permease protein
MKNLRAARMRGIAVVALVALAAVPLITNNYTQFVVNLAIAYVVVAIGQQIILGVAGQFAFANAAFMGIGAYATAVMVRAGLPFVVALVAGGLLCAAAGALVALPAMRMRRVYLAMATLAFLEMTQWVLVHWRAVTNGTEGMSVPRPSLFGPWLASPDKNLFFIVLAVTLVMLWLAYRLLWSEMGRAFIAIKENELVAACNGINVRFYKTLAFALSALYAGIGGGLFAVTVGFLVPDAYGFLQMILHFVIVMVGGLGTLSGAIIGSALLTVLPELLRGFQALQEILYGALLIIFMLFMPGGIAGLLQRRNLAPREILVRGWRELVR